MRRHTLPIWIVRLLVSFSLSATLGTLCPVNAQEDLGGPHAAMDPATGALKPPAVPDGSRFGVAHILPRYKPNGRLGPEILVEGAEDAYRLGFRTIKIGLSREVVVPEWGYYSLPTETMARIKSVVELARLDVYQKVFAMPFQTFILSADVIGVGHWDSFRVATTGPTAPQQADRPLSDEAKENIYRQIYQLSRHLLTTYRGTRKVFILQNHEGDWHTLPYTDPKLVPSDVALQNIEVYFNLRQKAVNDARREVGATDVYLYHMCEVNLVMKAMTGAKTVTNNVLPRIQSDLVGYSAYDTSSRRGGEFVAALRYLRSQANDSFAFGDNNVVISELGVAERKRKPPNDLAPEIKTLLEAVTAGVPWVIQWNLYDNECFDFSSGKQARKDDADAEACSGYWVRKPDGGLGRFFRSYQPYLFRENFFDPEPTDPGDYVERLFVATLGRKVGARNKFDLLNRLEARPWAKEEFFKFIVTSVEYKDRTCGSSAAVVFDAYRILLGRNPEPAVVAKLVKSFDSDEDRVAFLESVLRSDEGRGRFVTWLYRKYLNQPPDPEGLRFWQDALKRSASREQIHADFLRWLSAR